MRRRKGIILSIVALVTTLAALVAYQLTPRYTATAQLVIDPRQLRVVQMEAVAEGLTQDAAAIETQIKLVRAPALAERVIERLGLLKSPEFNPALRPHEGSALAILLTAPMEWAAGWLPPEWLIATGLADQLEDDPGAEPMTADEQRQAAVAVLQGIVTAVQDGRSHLISISATSPSPQTAAAVANAVAELYVEEQLEGKLFATRHASGWLGARIDELRQQVRAAEQAVETFRAENELIDTRGLTLGDEQLADLNRQLIMARAERTEKEAKLRLAREVGARREGYEGITEVLSSPVVQTLRREEAQLIRQEAQYALEFGERHPRIVHLRAEISNLREKVGDEIESILRNLENEVAVTRSRERSIEASLDDAQQLTVGARQHEVQLRELEREAEASRAIYAAFLQRLKETQEQQELVEPDARLVASAPVPEAPSFPNRKLITAGGFTFSLLLGTFLALLVERLDSGVRGSRQVEQLLGLATLGLVPEVGGLKRQQKLHHYLLQKPLSAYAEAIQSVYTGIQLSNVDQPPKVVLVTSSLPGEGKTTFAMSLAAIAARAGQRTMLVDLDLRHPSTHHELMQPVAQGLVEYLGGDCTLDDIRVGDEIEPRLEVIPVRRLTATPADLLRSEKLRRLIAELRAQYDFVVLDTTPLLGLADAKIAALLADKVIYVVRWEKTTEEIVQSGFEALREASADVAGVVLTRVDLKRHASYGYGDAAQFYGKYRKYYRS